MRCATNPVFTFMLGLSYLLISAAQASAVDSEAKKVFDSLFAGKIKAVSSTSDRADDIALAKEMLSIAKTSDNQPELLALLCDQIHDFSLRHPDGFSTGIEAQQLLADKVKDKRAAAQEKLTTLLTRQMLTGKADEREGAGETLIALLVSMGDEKFEKKEYTEAAGDYRRAATVATQRKSASLEEAKAKLDFAASRDRAVKSLARLQEKLLKDANDFATAEEIVKLYVMELDDPAAAVPYLNRVKDESFKKLAILATNKDSDRDAKDYLALAKWYKAYADLANISSSKLTSLENVMENLNHYLERHTEDDLDRKEAVLLREQIKQMLAPIQSALQTKTKSVDLLRLIDPVKDSIDGTWVLKDGDLYSPRKQSARIAFPISVSGDYRLQIKMTRLAGEDCVVIVIPVGPTQTNIVIDSFVRDGCFAGLETISGARARDNPTGSKGRRIKNEQIYTLEIDVSVRNDTAKIRATLDGNAFVDWEGRHAILGVNGQAAIHDRQRIGLMVWESIYSFRSIRLTSKPDATVKHVRE